MLRLQMILQVMCKFSTYMQCEVVRSILVPDRGISQGLSYLLYFDLCSNHWKSGIFLCIHATLIHFFHATKLCQPVTEVYYQKNSNISAFHISL